MSEQEIYNKSDDTIDLMALIGLLWLRKYFILGIALLGGLLSGGAAFWITPQYEVSVLLQPVSHDQGGNASLSGLGGIAALAGFSLDGTGSDTSVSIATLKSRQLIASYIEAENLLPVLFAEEWDLKKKLWVKESQEDPPTLWDGHKVFKKDIFKVNQDLDSGLTNLTMTWADPQVAVYWANGIVNLANTYLQEKAKEESQRNLAYLYEQMNAAKLVEVRASLSEMITAETERAMLANVSREYAFKVIDPASPPDLDDFSFPNRLLFIVLGLMVCGFLGCAVVVMLDASQKRS